MNQTPDFALAGLTKVDLSSGRKPKAGTKSWTLTRDRLFEASVEEEDCCDEVGLDVEAEAQVETEEVEAEVEAEFDAKNENDEDAA